MSVQHIAFRTDASRQIGTGHFMRCFTLADALQRRGVKIRFVSRKLAVHLRDMLAAKGMEFVSLNNNISVSDKCDLAHAPWLGTSQKLDARDSLQALADKFWDWLIVDHYALDYRWESLLRQSSKNIMVIDDIADRQHDCDILLDQNFYQDMELRYLDKVPKQCELLLGPRYALLREEFRQLRAQVKPRTGPVKRVLVFFGGVDGDNYTGRTIKALSEINIAYLNVDVVIGAQHRCCDEIKTACLRFGFNCFVQTEKMAELMARADLAIGAGGGAIWERCCLGLATLTICTAANQFNQIAAAARECFLYAPSMDPDLGDVIKNQISALIKNDSLTSFISNRVMQAVDGRGVPRLIGVLGCSGIKMRKVVLNDSPKLFKWRNHPTIRSVSRDKEQISWKDHKVWFTSVMSTPNTVLLVGLNDEDPIGVVRFDIQEDYAEISIYLVPDIDKAGQGDNLLLSGEQWIQRHRPDVKYIRSCVVRDNEPSHRLFLGAGYQLEETIYLKKSN